MTLDGVAERAQVSKGGLMYSYPTKVALLQGMIRRLLDNLELMREQLRAQSVQGKPSELMIEIKMLSQMDRMGSSPSAALLAAIANQPDLMEPFRDEMTRRFAERFLCEQNPDRSTVLFLAALGLHFAALLNVPFLDRPQREQAFKNLLRLAANDSEQL